MIFTQKEAQETNSFSPIIAEWKQGTTLLLQEDVDFGRMRAEWIPVNIIDTTLHPSRYRVVKNVQKYDWNIIPSWFNYQAFDEDGTLYAYTSKPNRGASRWHSEDEMLIIPKNYAPVQTVDWKDSLAQRPE